MLAWLSLAFAVCLASEARAQASFVFNGGGVPVASSATVIQQQLIRGSGLTWAVGDSGAVAKATAAANAALYGQGGQQVRLAGQALSRVAANDLAAAGVRGLRAGLPGVIASIALQQGLGLAKEYWDDLNKQMIYNPDPVHTSGSSGPFYEWSYDFSNPAFPPTTHGGACAQEGPAEFGSDYHGSYPADEVGAGVIGCTFTLRDPNGGPDYQLYRQRLQRRLQNPQPAPSTDSISCPNGATYSDTAPHCALPVSDQVGQDNLTPQITTNNGPGIAHDLSEAGQDINGASLPSVQLNPASGPTSTTQNADGTSTQVHEDYLPNCALNRCAVGKQTTTVQFDASGHPIGTPTVTTTQPSADTVGGPNEPSITCGLPATPPCKIDETGTPTVAVGLAAQAAGSAVVDSTQTAAIATVNRGAVLPNGSPVNEDRDIPWFTFDMPSTCSPLPTWANGPTVDICRFQPMFHDIMSIVWYMGTVFGLITMFGKAIRGE